MICLTHKISDRSPDTHAALAAETIAIRRMLIALQRSVRAQHELAASKHRRSPK
jgi:hypothetical protein